jgi:hypothetical protein
MSEAMNKAADELLRVAEELEAAATHARAAAQHFQAKDVPRAAAHEFAALGHLTKARLGLEALAIDHAQRSTS